MIKWLSGSRLKTATENDLPSPLTNDPLAAITRIATCDGVYPTYAVSRVNPLFKEDLPDTTSDQRSSPRKSISSGYESRCHSSSDSSSCTECEDSQVNKSLGGVRREKRLRQDKKKRPDHEKWLGGPPAGGEPLPSPPSVSRKPRKHKSGSPPGSSNLSPIPEGKVDCSIPPPIWPRFEELSREGTVNTQVPGRTFHNGTTTPLNFVFKYNEKYPGHCRGPARGLWARCEDGHVSDEVSVKTEYEHNWVECCRSHRSRAGDGDDGGKSGGDSGKGFTPESTLERPSSGKESELVEEVLRDLASLVSKRNSLPLECVLKNLAESIQRCLEVLSRTASEDSLRVLCENLNGNSYLNKVWISLLNGDEDGGKPLSITGDEAKNGVDTAELAVELEKLKKQSRRGPKVDEELSMYRLSNLKEEIYSSGSEGKNSSSSSSGCKDLYVSSNSSSAGKDNVFSTSSFESVRERQKKSSEEKKGASAMIHHQRDSSSSSTESAFGFSDSSHSPSDSSSAKGVLSPVFLHENIYSVPKSVRNAIMCDSLSRTKDADCGSSAFEKLISAKRKTSSDSRPEDLGPLAAALEGKTHFPSVMAPAKMDNMVLKKIEHPYYVAMGRPDFTLDLPQAEKLMKKIASSKRRRCWCRLTTSILGLVFFLLSVMMVSLVITKGRRMFGAI